MQDLSLLGPLRELRGAARTQELPEWTCAAHHRLELDALLRPALDAEVQLQRGGALLLSLSLLAFLPAPFQQHMLHVALTYMVIDNRIPVARYIGYMCGIRLLTSY